MDSNFDAKMDLGFDFNFMMQSALAERGISDKDISNAAQGMKEAFERVVSQRGKGWQEWTELPYTNESELDELISYCDNVRQNAESFVVFGIGGSALGPLSVAYSLLDLRHNELPKSARKAPKYYIEDNVDPERMASLLRLIDLKTSYFNVITKSGETSETLAQFLILYKLLKDTLGEVEAKKRIIVTTTIGKGTLYDVAAKEGFKIFGIGGGVGGRFSVFSNVGLVPLACLGIDIKKMLAGAAQMAKRCLNADYQKNPALLTAFLQVKSMEDGCNISVMMPYADSLKYMADFYCQLWGESLGKARNLNGELVFKGQTPAKSLGVTDQHSQVQLYTEGPFDKVITILAVDKFRDSVVISDDPKIAACDFLKGQTMDNLINFERQATCFALAKAGRRNFTVTLPTLCENTIGQLLIYFMYQTAFAGSIMGINTYDQPGVEEGKKATFAMFNRKGYESKLAEIKAMQFKKEYTL